MDDATLGGNGAYLVVVVGHIGTGRIGEVVANLIVPSEGDFNALVGHVATVDIRCACTGCGIRGRLN